MNIEIIEPRSFAAAVADEIVASINDSVEERGRASICLAGGGTPSGTYRLLARPPWGSETPWKQVTVCWGDERWVPSDHVRSNFRLAQETFLTHVPVSREHILGINTTLATPEIAAQDYQDRISAAIPTNPEGVPVFDLMLLGMGSDGHTASVFIGSEQQWQNSDSLCIAVEHPESKEPRITLTPKVLFAARRILFLVTGTAKAEMARTVLEGEIQAPPLPAQLAREFGERVTWFLDSAAATKLVNRTN